jgi:radical SAM protein with 4Fe4S-binding SPASM domain
MQELTPFTPMKLLRHAPKVEAMLRGEVVYPVSVELDLSNICNHGCPWCSFNGFRQENWQHFDTPRILSLLDELAAVGVQSVTFTGGGEPLVHAQAAEILTKASQFFEWGLVTNGRRMEGNLAALIAAHATFVRVSLDAGTTQTHQLLHATNMPEYTRILKNMAQVVALAKDRKKPLTVGASFCVFDVNLHEIDKAAERVKATGANYLEVRPVFPTEWRGGGFGNPLTGEHVEQAQKNLAAAKAKHDGDGFRVIGMIQRFEQVMDRTKPYKSCHTGPLTTVINADGNIYHCCQQRGMPAFIAGSVLKAPFKDVWLNAQHRQMIADIDIIKCPPCRYDGFNQLIEQAFIGDALHGNFL